MTVTIKVLIPSKIAEATQTDCWNWKGMKSRDGYGIVHRKNKLLKAHRIAYCENLNIALDDIQGMVIRHKCDNRACINPKHLEIGTSADNTNDRHLRGRNAKGSKNGNSKLTEENVIAIRSSYTRYSREYGRGGLAAQYNVSGSLIDQILRYDIWAHV